MKANHKKITAIIPCYNEEKGVGAVIQKFPREHLKKHGFELEILVIDNNSSDHTTETARSLGATVVREPKKGKGNAMRRGFYSISDDTDYVVMLDGDATYCPEEILRLIEPIDSDFCDVVIGSRLGGRISGGSMNRFNRAGNWVFSHLVRYFYRVNVTDVLSGYFAWKREALAKLRPHLRSEGFAIEMEMVTKMARLGETIYSVPITYRVREGKSNLNPFYDGIRIFQIFMRDLFWKPGETARQRIAFVSDTVFPYFKGGKEMRLYEISRRLAREGREIHVYTMQWWSGPKTIVREGVVFHALCNLHPIYVGSRRSIQTALRFGLATLKLLWVKFDVIDVDHIPLFPLLGARIVTWLRRKKLYATWHEVWGREYWLEYMQGPQGLVGHSIERLTFILPDVIISNSAHTTKRLQDAGVPCEIRTVTLGVDLESVYTAKQGEVKNDVIYVGRLLSHKNVDVLVRAIGRVKSAIPNIKTLIVGDGPEKDKIEKLRNTLGLQDNISLLSHVEDPDKYGLMKASKMLVLPSVREGFGLVVVEAHAAGIPVITTSHENNAAKDLIREGVNGFLCEPNEIDLAEKILRVLTMRQTFEPGRFVGQYGWDSVARNLGAVYHE